MTVPLMILAIPAMVAAWNIPGTNIGLDPLLRQAQPAGIAEGIAGGSLWPGVTMPAEDSPHGTRDQLQGRMGGLRRRRWRASCWPRRSTACASSIPTTPAARLRRSIGFSFTNGGSTSYMRFLFVRPVLRISGWVAAFDKKGIDWLADNSARAVERLARLDDWIDRIFVDALVNLIAQRTYALGLRLRTFQTGNIRQYVMWIVVGTVGLFVLMSLYWNLCTGGNVRKGPIKRNSGITNH